MIIKKRVIRSLITILTTGVIRMSLEKGNLSIHSDDIFPVIKKWLYSDHDIFVRELISNANDAITKFKQLVLMQEASIEDNENYEIHVSLDVEGQTLTFRDNGIGMTADEIKKYINQIAFSGAEDFINTYKDKSDKDQIIGHFGLGFYSAFMVAENVEILTRSYKEDSQAILWSCNGGTDFEMSEGSKAERGTEIILHISDDGKDFLNEHTLKETIKKYCSFMPNPIYLEIVGSEPEKDEEGNIVEVTPLNDITPLYLKNPSDCTDEEYIKFYQDTFHDYKNPLFWIHLNMDYPFNLKGILYFPKLANDFDRMEGQIKLYNSQVFIADNIKEVIPEFLLLLKGVIDCPDLPLNVSRSALQNDGFVRKISGYITKKVGDKLNGLFKTERENYESFWDDINPFIKFGTLKDDKFYESIQNSLIYKTIDDSHVTLSEYLEAAIGKNENKVFYVTDANQQSQYINLFKENNIDAVILEHPIDASYITMIESKNELVKFERVDSDISDHLLMENDQTEEEIESIKTSLETVFKESLKKDSLNVKVSSLKSTEVSSMVVFSEESRRMQEMMKMYGMPDMGKDIEMTLVLNDRHPLVRHLIDKDLADDTQDLVCKHLYDLALMAHTDLSPDQLTEFIKRSNTILLKLL